MQDIATGTTHRPLNKIELTVLTLFSAVMLYLISQVFWIAHKNSQEDLSRTTSSSSVADTDSETLMDAEKTTNADTIKTDNAKTITAAANSVTDSQANTAISEKNLDDTETNPEIISKKIEKPNLNELRAAEILANQKAIEKFCDSIDNKLGSVDLEECLSAKLSHSGAVSNGNRPLVYRDMGTKDHEATRVMLIGGIHGDEFSAVSIAFKWLHNLANAYSNGSDEKLNNIHWRVIPLLNPDGLLQPDGESTRMNANAVDLNRNFPTPDWDELAHKFWIEKRYRDKRRYPGPGANSEVETKWIVNQFNEFKPHAVISIHAPYGIVDADGPIEPPPNVGPLKLKLLGTYPGSMGRYVGVHKNLSMLTVELKHAGIMPSKKDIDHIWVDILDWIDDKVVQARLNNEDSSLQAIRHEINGETKEIVIDKKAGD